MRLALIALALAASFFPVAAGARTLDFGDLRRLVSLSDPQISPDGTSIVFVRGRADFEKDRMQNDLMLLEVRGKRMRQLTYDRRGVGSPQWSPDGTRIAFVASAPAAGGKGEPQSQIFAMPMNGGEAKRVTNAPVGVDNFAWSPDGSRFAYITQDRNPYQKQIEQHLDAFEVGDNDYLHTSAAIPSHLWSIATGGGKAHRLTSGSWSLGLVDPDQTSDISWSPDSRRIAIVRFPTPLVGDSLNSVIDVVDARTGARTRVTRNAGLEGSPKFAPVGEAIAYSMSAGGDATSGPAVYVTRPGGGTGLNVRAGIGRDINGVAWAPDGKALWLFGPDGTRSTGWYVSADGHNVRRLSLGDVAISATGNAARETGALAFVGTTNTHPSELYVLGSPSAKPVRLTNVNGSISGLELGRVVPLSWRNDGFAENGILTLPPGFRRGLAYPLVLVIHGGPQSASMQGWSSRRQLYAAHGYLVFEPNYRGSTNMGDRYQRAISRDAGAGPGRDAMAGVATVERLYNVDKSRIGVSGWSYGGYMTSWLTGHYHIWKVAFAGAALNDWFDDYNVAFYVHTDVPWFGGSPWKPQYGRMWREQSPIAYAQKITTPTMIMGDIGDNNVTITNSFKMYHALKDNGVPVVFVAYPVRGHFPSDPVRSEDVTRRWLGWLDKYLQGGTPR